MVALHVSIYIGLGMLYFALAVVVVVEHVEHQGNRQNNEIKGVKHDVVDGSESDSPDQPTVTQANGDSVSKKLSSTSKALSWPTISASDRGSNAANSQQLAGGNSDSPSVPVACEPTSPLRSF